MIIHTKMELQFCLRLVSLSKTTILYNRTGSQLIRLRLLR